MDTDLLLRDEHFDFESPSYLMEDTGSLDECDNFENQIYAWEYGNDINRENLMPVLTNFDSTVISTSPPSKEDFQKIMNDWQQLINIESTNIEDLIVDQHHIKSEENNDDELSDQKSSLDDSLISNNFDITKYITESPPKFSTLRHKGGKKIDFKAKRYILQDVKSEPETEPPVSQDFAPIDIKKETESEDENVDVETVSEHENDAILEAGDLNSLLEQFEATEQSLISTITNDSMEIDDTCNHSEIHETSPFEYFDPTSMATCVKLEAVEHINTTQIKLETPQEIKKDAPSTDSTASYTSESVNNKDILDALPQELIARIKESGKRKPISVIPPIPNKKRGMARTQEVVAQTPRNKFVKPVSNGESIQLDHDYCTATVPYPKHPQKDSGFESAEEEDKSLRNQPLVKNADGKLMVSLLKVNTIRNSENKQKRKLNLEEYKKRHEGIWKSKDSSRNTSPVSSTCSSPLPEDENIRRLKHQEKLKKMAVELLNTPPKSIKVEKVVEAAPVATPLIPPNMEVKTLVSIGVNTDIVNIKDKAPLEPVEQLEEIKPLLQNVKINCNSLITSVIENIPKAIENKATLSKTEAKSLVQEHGEDKTIVYLPKNRIATIKMVDAEVQTKISLLAENKRRYRRRRDSSTSSSSSYASTSTHQSRRRQSSTSSSSSARSTSTYSSRCSSRSRSRSPKHKRKRKIDPEHLREVEERRVVYVGRILPGTTREDLRRRFQRFGTITNISIHFRNHGDNYGFVTFLNKLDAYEAIEHANDDPYYPKYDLSFGGRRLFCKTSYSDLDNVRDDMPYYPQHPTENSFDRLLREAQEKLKKRKV